MQDSDITTILTALSDSRNELTKAIGELHSEFSGFKGNMEARVMAVEEDQEKADKRQWYHSAIVALGTIVHHDLGTWLHWKL
jgi:hypothetical protein